MKYLFALCAVALLSLTGPAAAEGEGGYEGPPKTERPNEETPPGETPAQPVTVTATGGNPVANGIGGDPVANANAGGAVVNTNHHSIARYTDAIDLMASMSTNKCIGASTTASANGADGLIGGAFGIGRTGLDKECVKRENLRVFVLLMELAAGTDNALERERIMLAASQMKGLEFLWFGTLNAAGEVQHRNCRKWLATFDDAAEKHGCQYPTFN